jgi:glyoxylase-like metal-dependent hydrolase (beta-lactamase superfamily II)
MTELCLLPHVFEVAGPHLTGRDDCSCFLIKDDPSVLIDCGTPGGVDRMCQNISSTGTRLEQIDMMIGTHCHYDHVAGAAALKERFPIELWMHEADRQAVERGDSGATVSQSHFGVSFPAVEVEREIKDGEVIGLKDCQLTIVHTPGHTPGHVSVLATWGGFTCLFAGEAVWGGYDPDFYSGIETWHASLHKLLTYDFDVLVWGHTNGVVYGDARRRVTEAMESLGVFHNPWHTRPTGVEYRYGGDRLKPGMTPSPIE